MGHFLSFYVTFPCISFLYSSYFSFLFCYFSPLSLPSLPSYPLPIVFGDVKTSTQASNVVFSIHSRVNGTLELDIPPFYKAGDAYDAMNIDALKFVYCTLLDYNLFCVDLVWPRGRMRLVC